MQAGHPCHCRFLYRTLSILVSLLGNALPCTLALPSGPVYTTLNIAVMKEVYVDFLPIINHKNVNIHSLFNVEKMFILPLFIMFD